MIEIPLPRGRVVVLGTVHGLAAEAERVREAFARTTPATVALGVSPEGVAGLRYYLSEEAAGKMQDAEEAAEDLSDADVGYGFALNNFGKVLLPPRCLVEAVRLADAQGVPVAGADFAEEAYERTFTKHVGALALLRYSRRARKLAQAPPEAATARDFAVAWDRELTQVKGYAQVEAAREAHIAQTARDLASGVEGPVLLLVEVAREAGVTRALRAAGRT